MPTSQLKRELCGNDYNLKFRGTVAYSADRYHHVARAFEGYETREGSFVEKLYWTCPEGNKHFTELEYKRPMPGLYRNRQGHFILMNARAVRSYKAGICRDNYNFARISDTIHGLDSLNVVVNVLNNGEYITETRQPYFNYYRGWIYLKEMDQYYYMFKRMSRQQIPNNIQRILNEN